MFHLQFIDRLLSLQENQHRLREIRYEYLNKMRVHNDQNKYWNGIRFDVHITPNDIQCTKNHCRRQSAPELCSVHFADKITRILTGHITGEFILEYLLEI